MKKNLIASLKKLLKAFGGENTDSNSAVDLVDKIADSIEEGGGSGADISEKLLHLNNMNATIGGYQSWLEIKDYYTTSSKSLFKDNVTYNIPIKVGISETMISKNDWFEYLGTESQFASGYTVIENIYKSINSYFGYARGIERDDETFKTIAKPLYQEFYAMHQAQAINLTYPLTQLGYFILSNYTKGIQVCFTPKWLDGKTFQIGGNIFSAKSGFSYFSINYYPATDTVDNISNFGDMELISKYKTNMLLGTDEKGYFKFEDKADYKPLIVTITQNGTTYSADKTDVEIYEAAPNKTVLCYYDNVYFPLIYGGPGYCVFGFNLQDSYTFIEISGSAVTIREA